MGVRGLTTFVDGHPELLTDYQLHGTRLIIDGNNLYHFLYYRFHIPCEYGGDYDHFARSCETFFNALDACSVVPFVVFDGAHAADGSKFHTSLSRACERVHMSNIMAWGRHAKILPVLTHSCFVHLLTRLGIQHVTCDFEADRQIAALARHWHCPVLTNDSDFFVYDIPAGVVLLDYLNLRWKVRQRLSPRKHPQGKYRYLEGQAFYCQKFMKFLHVTEHTLVVLFATLLGNDIIDGRNFESFFSYVKLPKPRGRTGYSQKQCRMDGAIAWLQTVHSVKEAIAFVLSILPQDRRKHISLLMETSLQCYLDLSSDLHEYFEAGADRRTGVGIFGGCILPEWLVTNVRRGMTPTAMLNVMASHRVLFMSQVELSSEVSSYRCSQKLRQLAYGIALGRPSGCADSSGVGCVNEYDREHKMLKTSSVEPLKDVNGNVLPCVTEVDQMDRRRRFLFVLEALDTSVDCVFELLMPDVQFLVATLRYWTRHANAKISMIHVHALLLCFVRFGSLESYLLLAPQSRTIASAVRHSTWLLQKNKSAIFDLAAASDDNTDLFVDILNSLATGLDGAVTDEEVNLEELERRGAEVRRTKEKLLQFESAPRQKQPATFSADIVYAFAEFQTCFIGAACVANMLGLSVHDPAAIFSGTFLYHLTRELQNRTSPDLYISELLGGPSSPLSKCYFDLMNIILGGMPEGRLAEVVGGRVKKKRRTKKVAGRTTAVDSDDSESLVPEEQVADGNGGGFVLNCDIDNRFSNLSFSEE